MSKGMDILGPNTRDILSIGDEVEVELLNDWSQQGGETFSTDFILHFADRRLHLIAKACIKYFPVETVDEWLSRRRILEESGVSVPELYARDRAVLVEEFIPYSLPEAYKRSDSQTKEQLRQAFVDTYKKVQGAGFGPISLHDARSRGSDVVLIDMGEDIGSPNEIDICNLEVISYAEVAFRSIVNLRGGEGA